jgi:mono/diheme cytochrome c family protein
MAMRRLILAASVLAATASPALAQDVLAGRELAQRWCADCHLVAPGQATASSDSVPTFMAVAARQNVTADALRAFLANPHGRMPPLVLSNADIDNMAAYILSLRGK